MGKLASSAVLQIFLCLSFGFYFQPALAVEKVDATERTALVSSFEPEWQDLQGALKNRTDRIINGTDFATGEFEGKPVVLFLTGISMVNAAMTTQLALDRFNVRRIVFSGVAGGVDPKLHIGDVVIPDQWREYLETVFARESAGKYKLPDFIGDPADNNFGMIFPRPVQIAHAPEKPEDRTWFPVDPDLLAIARKAANATQLEECTADHQCLALPPKVVVGGNGVSGGAFVDNRAFREYASQVYKAEALDMESAAVGHVAYANEVPYIVFRSLSDLAGGDAAENQMKIFQNLASGNSALVVKAFMRVLP
jgi:adenosylhomocysteine nucleosidase